MHSHFIAQASLRAEGNSFKNAGFGMEGESAGTDLSSGTQILIEPSTRPQGSKATMCYS